MFDFIFNYYYSGLCVYARQFTGAIESAEDIVQEFFVNLWTKASSITIESSLRAYMFASVRNKSLDFLKHNRVKEKFQHEMIRNTTEPGEEIFNRYIESELRQAINQSLDKLPPRCREIFTLSRFEGKSNQEIANQLGISKRTVELQVSNALSLLRKELKGFLPGCLIALFIG